MSKFHAYSSKHYVAEFNGDGYTLTYDDGYVSKVPINVFQRDFRSSGSLTFGDALLVLERGGKVARSGWNGKGMYLVLVPDDEYEVGMDVISVNRRLPWIGMKTADNCFVPWLASQTDVLAKDWCVLNQE